MGCGARDGPLAPLVMTQLPNMPEFKHLCASLPVTGGFAILLCRGWQSRWEQEQTPVLAECELAFHTPPRQTEL